MITYRIKLFFNFSKNQLVYPKKIEPMVKSFLFSRFGFSSNLAKD